MDAVEVIYNEVTERQFDNENKRFSAQYEGIAELRGEGQTELQKNYLLDLITRFNSSSAYLCVRS